MCSTDVQHRMLEDPSYASVVRWGDEMDSFVVLEVRIHPKLVLVDERLNCSAE